MIAGAMTAKLMIDEFPWNSRYAVDQTENILTPALVIYPELVDHNIRQTLQLLEGNPDRWRIHVKTAKLQSTMERLVSHGVVNFKAATTLELLTACASGAKDVLVAYPVMGANARRLLEISEQYDDVQVSVLIENEAQLQQWRDKNVGIFLDINPGMDRTGIALSHSERVFSLVSGVKNLGLEFRGLHYYDGQYGSLTEQERCSVVHQGYDQLLNLVRVLERAGHSIREIVTAGTPTFPCSLSYTPFHSAEFIHRVSPGTIVYCDATSLAQLSHDYGYQPAALVLTRVVSQPRDGMITCDAGHKSVSADAGVPTCIVLGHPELLPLSPSEEHLPMSVRPGAHIPSIGDQLYLLPRHICPTVNNFNSALLVKNGVVAVEPVTARGREGPLLAETLERARI
jgi:D-serine deaminase-like pyridoxal phosphate-dependent protein